MVNCIELNRTVNYGTFIYNNNYIYPSNVHSSPQLLCRK